MMIPDSFATQSTTHSADSASVSLKEKETNAEIMCLKTKVSSLRDTMSKEEVRLV